MFWLFEENTRQNNRENRKLICKSEEFLGFLKVKKIE
jgi:hypothetical protein